ncbi:MAG: hypothetical protein ACYTG0_02745 [Planctomycetota bacterium]|jgi:hypothetical protein
MKRAAMILAAFGIVGLAAGSAFAQRGHPPAPRGGHGQVTSVAHHGSYGRSSHSYRYRSYRYGPSYGHIRPHRPPVYHYPRYYDPYSRYRSSSCCGRSCGGRSYGGIHYYRPGMGFSIHF